MPNTDSAPFSYDGLDRVIHEKARLGLLTSLMAHPRGLAFADLKQLCGLTDGRCCRKRVWWRSPRAMRATGRIPPAA
jgi:hypothetical protein